MKSFFYCLVVFALVGAYFFLNDPSPPSLSNLKIEELPSTPKQPQKTSSETNLSAATIKHTAPSDTVQEKEEEIGPILIRTPTRSKQHSRQPTKTKIGGEIRIFLPKNTEPANGFLVIVPKDWKAESDPSFNPLLKKYKAPWAVSLKKSYPDHTVSNKKLPQGAYNILMYRNDGKKHKKPTRVGSYEVTSGGHTYITQKDWDKL